MKTASSSASCCFIVATGNLGTGFVGGLIFVAAFAAVLTWLCVTAKQSDTVVIRKG